MARGIIGGMVFGGAISVVTAASISILLDPPTRPEVAAETPSAARAPAQPESEAKPGFGDADLVTDSSDAPALAPKPEDASAALRAGGDTPRVPETGVIETPSFENGSSGSETALSALPQNQPVLQAPQAAPPPAPGAEAELSISTEPAQPPAPKVEDPLDSFETSVLETPSAPQAPSVGEADAGVTSAPLDEAEPAQDLAQAPEAPASETAPDADTPADLPQGARAAEEGLGANDASVALAQAPLEPSVPDQGTELASLEAPEEATPGALPAIDQQSAPAPVEETAAALDDAEQAGETALSSDASSEPGATEEPATQADLAPSEETPAGTASTETAPEDVANADDAAAPQPEEPETQVVAQAPEAGSATRQRPSVGRPASSIINRSAQPERPQDTPAEAVVLDGPPMEVFAAKFENPDQKPLMSIVLIDGASDLASPETGLTALESFPFPVSFAVDVAAPDAKERMAAYRTAGFEVLAMMDLPQGATAQDAAVNLDAALAAVPQAVALIEGPGAGLQTSSAVTDQLIASLKDSGHGIVLQAKGLNSAHKDAARAGVPARIVFRDFDSAGQDARTIRRFLDQAAFRAGQEGGVIMMGRLRADTISALLIWGNQDRANRVALAPVSAVLTR